MAVCVLSQPVEDVIPEWVVKMYSFLVVFLYMEHFSSQTVLTDQM